MTTQLVLVLVLALVAAILGAIDVVRTKGQSLVAWAVVALGVGLAILVT